MQTEVNRERKLAVILHADIVGSTTLVHRDETIAHVRITDAFSRFSKEVIAYAGTVREIRGDALVAEFARASDALSCALAAQAANTAFNATLDDDIRAQMRVGIALGEVVIADATVTGPGIVLAQRLEQLAEPGGVCVQGSVYEAAPRRMPFVYTNLGEREVKGFDESVRAFAVALKPGEAAPPPDVPSPAGNETAPARPRWLAGAMVLLLLIAVGLVTWFQPWKSDVGSEDTQNVAGALPDKPSIAVLPFDNLSDDRGQDYFADGMTEDIITDLSKISGLFVIARNSSFVYRGQSVDIKKVGRELGVKFVLEGSVRRAGDEIRVNTQLIDAQTGGHLWAERIDGKTADIFKLQDQVTQRIVGALKVKLTGSEQQRLKKGAKVNPQAYELYLQGKQLQATQQAPAQMLKLYGHAVKLDPNFAEAHARLANVAYDVMRTDKFWILPQKEALALIESHAAKALALEPDNAMTLATLAHQALEAGQTDEAIKLIERAVSAAPSDVDALARQTYILSRGGRYDDAAATAELVLRLEPNPTAAQLMLLSNVYLHARQYEKSVKYGEMAKELGIRPVWALETLVAGYARLKMQTKLDQAKAELLALWPDVCLRYWRHLFDYFRPPATLDHWLESQRLAGIPEWPQGLVPSPENMLTKPELAAVFDPDVQRIGQQVRAGGTGWRWRSASDPDGGDTSIWRSSKGQQFVFAGTKPRLVMAKNGRQVQERCTRDPDHDMGRERCYLILHNPGGSKATRDEYLLASYRSLSKFTVFPRDEEIDWTKDPE